MTKQEPPTKDYLAALDSRLNYLVTNLTGRKVQLDERTTDDAKYIMQSGISPHEMVAIYKYLVDEEYIIEIPQDQTTSTAPSKAYLVLMKGYIHHASGGFVGEQKRNQTALQRITNLEDNKKDTDKQITFLTYVIAGAAVLAFFAQLIQIAFK